MHNRRNRMALRHVGQELKSLPHGGGGGVGGRGAALQMPIEPRFPADVRIPPPNGAVIVSVPVPVPLPVAELALLDARIMAEAALILPEGAAEAAPALKPAAKAKAVRKPRKAKVSRSKSAKGKTKSRAAIAPAAITPAAASALAPAQPAPGAPSIGLQMAGGPARVPPATGKGAAIDDRTPFAPLPRDRSVARADAPGIVSRLVRWLDALSFVVIGQPLPRKRRRAALPRSRQVLSPPQARRRSPPSRSPVIPGGGAGDELARLRAENARLRKQLSQLAKAALAAVEPAVI